MLVFVGNLLWSYCKGKIAGQRSLGRVDAGMVHDFAAAGLQLRDDSDGPEPAPAVGPEASGRSGLEIRIEADRSERSASIRRTQPNSTGSFPHRGRVGMYCLIAAEAAIFIIFVVAYIFYIGKSLAGRRRKMFSMFRFSTPFVCFPAA